MKFRRLGRAYHPVIETAAELKEACTLDEALWVATSAPVHAFRMDPVFLSLLDCDQDTRIKTGEVREAVTWALAHLEEPSPLETGDATLTQKALRADQPDTPALMRVFEALAPEGEDLPLQVLREARHRLEQQPVSEAGVILPDAAETPEQRAEIEQVLSMVEGAPHPSGKAGLSRAVIEDFGKKVSERLAWQETTREADDLGRSRILPLGEATPAAYQAFDVLRKPIEHFFSLCSAMEMAPEAAGTSWPGMKQDLAWEDTGAVAEAMRKAPLAKPTPERILKVDRRTNPAWQPELHVFRQEVLIPLLDRTDDTLTEEVWHTVCERLQPYADWKASEPHTGLAALSEEDLKKWAAPENREALSELCDRPDSTVLTLSEVRLAEKLSLYQQNLLTFANNFIAFPHLYQPETRASFEVGTLVMDGRKFHLSVRVPDRKEYLKSLEGTTMFVMVVHLVNPQLNQTFEVAVPATAGQQGNLRVGKHGVFEHVDGTQWFATVVHIHDNAISFAEAVFEPFRRLGQAVTKKIESLTQAAEKKLEATGGEAVTQLKGGATPASGGMLAGGGIAVAALGSSLAFITKIFAELRPMGVAQGLLAAILAVLVPGSIIAALRLSKRDLSVLLEGADWAVNSRMRLNAAQRKSFTRTPPFPEGTRLLRPLEWWLWRLVWILVLIALLVNGGARI